MGKCNLEGFQMPIARKALQNIEERAGGKYYAMVRNPMSGKEHEFELTQEQALQLTHWAMNPQLSIQDTVPTLTKDQAEMCLSGMSPEEWNETFGDEDEDDDDGYDPADEAF
jgi:hypothetical protein